MHPEAHLTIARQQQQELERRLRQDLAARQRAQRSPVPDRCPASGLTPVRARLAAVLPAVLPARRPQVDVACCVPA